MKVSFVVTIGRKQLSDTSVVLQKSIRDKKGQHLTPI
jgi:hypothetical protein